MKPKKILMPSDASTTARVAFDAALLLAEHYHSELLLLHVEVLHDYDPATWDADFPSPEEIQDHLAAVVADELSQWASEAAGKEQKFRLRELRRRGLAAGPVITEVADEENVDLIVMGTHGRRGLRRLLLGSTTDEVLRTARCPVMILRDPAHAERLARLGNVVVPYDFSDDSERALRWVLAFSEGRDMAVHLVHAIQPPVHPELYGPLFASLSIDMASISSEIRDELRREARRVVGDSEVDLEVHVEAGAPGRVVHDLAETLEADLVVVGSHGRSGWERLLLGSVAEQITRTIEKPVVVLRPQS